MGHVKEKSLGIGFIDDHQDQTLGVLPFGTVMAIVSRAVLRPVNFDGKTIRVDGRTEDAPLRSCRKKNGPPPLQSSRSEKALR